MTPEPTDDGQWRVGDRVFETNAKAWRWIDMQEGSPLSRAEDTAAWVWNRIVNGN